MMALLYSVNVRPSQPLSQYRDINGDFRNTSNNNGNAQSNGHGYCDRREVFALREMAEWTYGQGKAIVAGADQSDPTNLNSTFVLVTNDDIANVTIGIPPVIADADGIVNLFNIGPYAPNPSITNDRGWLPGGNRTVLAPLMQVVIGPGPIDNP